ncbi:MAG: penicillin acylase family protein, partial [Candidatus Limnocylindria bacterium]|nr:penicillin acylase family protein [Candidatus Limnocylindria bacterium]
MRRRILLLAAAAAAGSLAVLLAPLTAATPRDYAAAAFTILPPGENGSLSFDRNTTDQAKLYDALTPLFDKVTQKDIARTFKPAPFGLGGKKALRTESTPRGGVKIVRDRFDVPHVTGKTAEDVAYGAGWVTAQDRGILLELIRGPARIAALDVPGLDPISLALSGKSFVPSAQTEAFIAAQIGALKATGPLGKQFVRLLNAYVAGLNGYYRSKEIQVKPYAVVDVIAAAALIAARFGANGGQEAANAQFLDALQDRLGAAKGREVFDDLRTANDPEAPVSLPGSFEQQLPPIGATPGSVVLDDGSFATAPRSVSAMSNALLVGAKRSATGHPLFVAGPQVGYFFPQFFLEADLHGGGFDVRGVIFPGVPFVVIGRGADFAWSATSSQADNIDLFAETLCGGDDRHYLHKGVCRAMTVFDAGTLKAAGVPDEKVSFLETVHGPVQGYATVGGAKVALALQRSTRGREMLSARSFWELNTSKVSSARSFLKTMNGIEFSFNWFYADDRDIALFSSGRLPKRAAGTDPALPTAGTGEYDWRGFLTAAEHAQGINPPGGVILNWNNKPAADVGSADSNFSYGPVQRVDLFTPLIAAQQKHTLASVTAVMNKAATQDLRVLRAWPTIKAVLEGSTPPSARAADVAGLLDVWRLKGGSRLDRDLDGKVDDPGAAAMDAAWPKLADAVLGTALGPLTDRLAKLMDRSDDAGPGGSAYISGWYGYVDKDLRSLLKRPVKGAYKTKFCGAGDLALCRAALWAALDAAGAELVAAQGAAPSAWRADATKERIRFT